ncbi:uncharacterized protein LOC124178294 [Neodiprion fabricii]|uniref:uncharacterized protein LOC124178294 n=1 Tax=Neodiprion fabricii TaxID=2872261 RepID=UPI001ED977C5|nr:uncharacterized protein LOC124178294 [Neodiprion fabricii]
MFHSPPTATAIPNSTRFEGVDQMVLDTIGRYTNSTMKIHESNPRQHFGTVTKKCFLETLKEVANRKVDIAGNMRFIMPYDGYNMSVFEFTSPVFTDRISLIVPKAKKVPIWLSMYHIFDYRVWIPTSCLIVMSVILWLSILKFRHNEDFCGQVGWVTINILFLMTGHPISRTIIPLSERLLVVCGLFFAIIMVNSFTSHLFQAYSQVTYWPEIKTLVELNKSGLTIVEGSWGAVRALGETDNPILKELLQKIDHTKDESTAYDLNNGVLDHAILARESRGKYEATNLFLNNNGTELTYAIQSSMLDTFSMAYIVPRGSSFLKKFNTYINRILEAGLVKKWFEDSMSNYTWKVKYMTLKSSSDIPRAFVLSDLKLSWYILTAGLTISCITFLFELVWQFQCHRRLLRKCNGLFFKLTRNIRMRNENSN